MINRTLLRIKAVQHLYAFQTNDGGSLSLAETELTHSIKKTYELYYHLLNLSIVITDYVQNRIEAAQNKFRPTPEERNPNLKFVHNLFIAQLRENLELRAHNEEQKLSWVENPEVVKSLVDEIVASDFYKTYMENRENNYAEDKQLWRNIYMKIVVGNENLDEAIEEQSIYWVDDVDMILSFIVKTVKRFDAENGAGQELLPLEEQEDYEFAQQLFSETVVHYDEYKQLIEQTSKNWDLERIAMMDIIIMAVAITEFMNFPTIPINVSINEYIEIAKYYSTERSNVFINGVLDKIAENLKKEKKILKVELTNPKNV